MARGRKKMTATLEEQIDIIQAEIDKTAEYVRSLKLKKKGIEEKISNEKKEKLYQAVMKSGKTMDEVLAIFSEEGK